MRARQVFRLIHPGVTRVFGAGLRAGNLRLALRAVLESAVALLIALRVSGQRPGRQNAMRHFIWQARLVMAGSTTFATRVGDLHEQGSPDPLDSRVDQCNNAVGRQYAEARAAHLAGLSTLACFRELTDAALAKWEAGELWTGEDGAVRRSAERRR